MKLQFWGAARTVAGSMHLLEVAGRRVLLDCGMYQGSRKKAFELNRDLPFEARSIDVVVLSHTHIDHSGNLPTLARNGFGGPIYCTPATGDLAALLLRDSAKIQESDIRRVNRRRKRDGKQPFEPLYTEADAVAALECRSPWDGRRYPAGSPRHGCLPSPPRVLRRRDAEDARHGSRWRRARV